MRRALVFLLPLAIASACSANASDACKHFYRALGSNHCGGISLASQDATIDRYAKACEQAFTLPGTSLTPGAIDSCAGEYESRECGSLKGLDSCVTKPGGLADGAACQTDAQCKSTDCDFSSGNSCGKCVPTISEGGKCDTLTRCVKGLACENGVCTKPTYSGSGETCDNVAKRCDNAFRCDSDTKTCKPWASKDQSCYIHADCRPPLVCIGSKCTDPPGPGEDCSLTSTCHDALCETTTKKCVVITFPKPGEPCGVYAWCQHSVCSDAVSGGVCPEIIPDGQPCNAADRLKTCDTAAECINGVCVLGGPTCGG